MLIYLARRLVVALGVCIAVSLLSFGLMFLVGDPAIAIAGSGGSAKDAEAIRIAYGFDRPFLVQYLGWIGRIVRGDLGDSIYFNMPVTEIIAARLPVTLVLGAASFVVALVVALPLGILAALKPNGLVGRVALVLAVTGQAIPSFWLGLMAIVVFGVWYEMVPISGADEWQGYILPVVVLAYSAMPAMMRITRSGMIDVLGTDYIRTAYAKGLSGWRVIASHALRNAILPLVSLAVVQLGVLLSGSIVIESVFALNGLGRLAWESLLRADLPVVQAIILILSLVYVLLTTAGDLINAWLDPRIRGSR
ncbi:ABC transporter permease (plasmid) [Agrobacterium tumefaciens]|uniref:ABC transporter permease n=1 Tax=Agrobacterium tumefaciens TaxID=358 RepID=A0AAP9E9Q2_AGRTU|nr:ABC transporter permease [Agrobacterium tumefaciens]NSZ61200.1 ABC transporter permease [Agrobacterium tumefaciens]QDY97608.1 ABC transporter permease [Agrobacterium tumefaciens]UXS12734.1 ABC transporter permease [Agrobacterium tumefaciens]UXS20096.1 ABC transporter permease [Agrobacterium tumefaciens]UXS27744.1 ABC transporter permease [Agrobacterium tumefaciens]